eukprot:GHVS01035075.1.p1 GENE.GHVS01035075.1~~GHVS01035075.1.p1  ORF type:complete len:214 (+),score=25.18 GHVS01035075.1:148-789(+)
MQGGGYNPAYAGPSAAVVADAAAHHYHESQIEDSQQNPTNLFCGYFPPLKTLFGCIPLRSALYVIAFLHLVGIFASVFRRSAAPLTSKFYWIFFSFRLCCFLFCVFVAGFLLKAAELPATETTLDILRGFCTMQLIFCALGYIISALCVISAIVCVVGNPRPLNGIARGFLEYELQGAVLLFVVGSISLHFAHVYWSYAFQLRNQLTAVMLLP